MLADLRARFRAPFVETARRRIVAARAHIAESDLASASIELHSLAGEAGMLNFVGCATLAREGEDFARSGEGRKCKDALESLEKAIDAVAT